MLQFVRARKAVVSNASMWDTLKLLPPGALPDSYVNGVNKTPQCESFMHLHLGFDAKVYKKQEEANDFLVFDVFLMEQEQGIADDLEIHHIVVNDWDRGVDADQNVVLISVPSVLSPNLAPPGKHVLHSYLPGTEPFGLWEGLDRRSVEYKNLKTQRSEVTHSFSCFVFS